MRFPQKAIVFTIQEYMKDNFWLKLKAEVSSRGVGEPIMVLAPMADVTDAAFRRLIAKYSKWGGQDIGDGSKENLPAGAFRSGGPDVFWTEFVSADGLCHKKGREKLLIDLSYTEAERPIVAQLFSGNPEKMFEAARLIKKLGFDGLDINMGCPDRSIEKSGAGAALIKNPKLAREIIRAAKAGVSDSDTLGNGIPISVKTRIGYNRNELDKWLPELLAEDPAVVTIHCRTRKEMSDVPARWEEVKHAVEIRNSLHGKTLIFGNGDVLSVEDARALARASGADGVMLGRAIFGNPFLFAGLNQVGGLKMRDRLESFNVETRLKVMLEHTKLFQELFNDVKNFSVMKKHYKAYVNGWDGAKDLRTKLMEANDFLEVEALVKNYLKLLMS